MAEALPKAVRQAEVKIGSITLRVHHLDDGRRVIDAASMDAFMEALSNGSLVLSEEDATKMAKVIRE